MRCIRPLEKKLSFLLKIDQVSIEEVNQITHLKSIEETIISRKLDGSDTLQGTYTSTICIAIVICDGLQRFATNAATIESDGRCVCCQSLKAIAGNNHTAYLTRVNPLLNGMIFQGWTPGTRRRGMQSWRWTDDMLKW